MKKLIIVVPFMTLTLAVSSIFNLMSRFSASAKSSAASPTTQAAGITLPNVYIYALTTDNTIFVLTPGSNKFIRLVSLNNINGNLIGLDFRPADSNNTSVYGLTDTGNLYLINLNPYQLGATTLVSSLSPRFAGGVQSLMDFNPVVNALRLIGTNDQNFAILNNASGGNLNQTVPQTAMAYAAGDVNAGVDPNITGGAYTNNVAGATTTIFYGIDFDLDTFVTIATKNNGSSATGGGQLQTIGKIVDPSGNPVNIAPTADLDIYTDGNGVNTLVAISGRMLYTIDLSQINQSLPLGTTQNVVANGVTMPLPTGDFSPTGVFIDIAIPTYSAAPAPAPAPTPPVNATPSPVLPIVECVTDNGNGTLTARFGYSNPNQLAITIPVGADNRLIPAIGQQPITFQPGRQRNVFTVTGSGSVVWLLNGRTATASVNSAPQCR